LGLARHAADVDAGAAENAALHHDDLRAAFGGRDGRGERATARSNNGQVVPIARARVTVAPRRRGFGRHTLGCPRAIGCVGERGLEASGVDAGRCLEARLAAAEVRLDLGGASPAERVRDVPFAVGARHAFDG
jgi:hypothetical protein